MNAHHRLSRVFGALAVIGILISAAMAYYAIWGGGEKWVSTAILTFFLAVLMWVGNLITSDVDL